MKDSKQRQQERELFLDDRYKQKVVGDKRKPTRMKAKQSWRNAVDKWREE